MYYSKIKHLTLSSLYIVLILLLSACGNNLKDITTFLDAKEAVYEDISIQMGEAYWNLYSDEAEADLKAPKERYVDLYTNDTLISIIEEWYPKRNMIDEKILVRRMEVWHNILTAAKINYAEENLKLQNELEFWLGEPDTAEGKPSDAELKKMVIQLMKQRNEQAKAMGYENYAVLMLDITETGYDWLAEFVRVIDERTYEPYKILKEEYLSETGKSEFTNDDARSLLMPYYINQITPDLSGESMRTAMKNIIDGIGLDYDNLPFRVVENEMPPGVGGQGIAVQIPGDFRIALMPGLGFATWMHELGHGLQAMHTTIESPILKGYEWSFGSGNGGFAEGMAEVSARFARNVDIAKQFSDLSDEELAEKIAAMNKHRAAYFRYWLAIFMFEIEYYKDLDQDPDELRRSVIQKYRLLDSVNEETAPLLDMVFVSYPLYLQNYVIAEIISWQVHHTLLDKFGESYINDPATGQFLIDSFYKDGATMSWKTCLKNATGKELDLDGYFTFFGL